VPIPPGAEDRRIRIGQFGQLDVYVLHPYTIALSKLDRGFESDIEDILFLIRREHSTIDQLAQVASNALVYAGEFNLVAANVRAHLATVRTLLNAG